MEHSEIEIGLVQAAAEFEDAKQLICEYIQWLGFDLSFQNIDAEMDGLPEMYNKNDGGLFIARLHGKAVGVAGLRRFSPTESEVKRMFVKDAARGTGVGRRLLAMCIERAKELKYDSIKLDTADFMAAAIKLYTDHGFVEIPAYRFNPHEHARYFSLALKS